MRAVGPQMKRIPPIALSLSLCVLGYAAVATILLPNGTDTLARDAADDERLAAGSREVQPR
jgi:hypothetical protein